MKVLQFYRTYMPETQGGLEEAIRQICIATGKHGVQHRILTLARVPSFDRLQLPEAEVLRVPLQWEPASCSMGWSLFRAYREQARWADLIHVHYPWPFADLVHLLSGTDRPVVMTYHSDIIRQRTLEKLYAPLRSLFFRKLGAVVATSPNYVESSPVLSRFDRPPQVIPLGLSPESYPQASEESLHSVDCDFGSNFFLFIGVLRYYKGLHNLIEAAAETGLPVVIAGDGPEAGRLKKLARQRRAPNVRFCGYVSNDIKQALFQRCRAVVFPSCERSEAFGVTLLEGQLHCRPLITAEIGTGTSYVNVDGETGIVVAPNDPQALGAAMRELHNNRERAESMGANGRRRLQSMFSGDIIGRQYAQLYQNVLEQRTI